MDWMPQAVRDGVIVILVISGPPVVVAAIIGLVIGILQAATQVQEQTIGSAVKIIGVFALIIAFGYWMFAYLNQYTSRTLSTAFTFVPSQSQKVLSPEVEKEFYGMQNPTGNIPKLPLPPPLPNKLENEYLGPPVGAMYLGKSNTREIPGRGVVPGTEPEEKSYEETERQLPEGYQEPIPLTEE